VRRTALAPREQLYVPGRLARLAGSVLAPLDLVPSHSHHPMTRDTHQSRHRFGQHSNIPTFHAFLVGAGMWSGAYRSSRKVR
jgi:hypothetical protein